MKKKLFLLVVMVAMLACLFAISTLAAAPDTTKETFTLEDGTVLPIWDTDGNGLIWYKSTLNTDDGYENYDYVHNNQTDSSIMPYITHSKGAHGRALDGKNYTGYQTSNIKITDANGTYSSQDQAYIVVANLKGALYSENQPFTMYNSTFKNSDALEAVYFDPATIFFVGGVVQNSANIRKINLEETILGELGTASLAECPKLAEIKLPNTLITVGEWVFQNTAITEITIPTSVKSWGATNFKNCKNLKKVNGYAELFERGVLTEVQSNTFLNCTSLVEIFPGNVFSDSITKVGYAAFQGCTSFGPILVLPNTLTEVGQQSFLGCTSLEKVVLGSNMTTFVNYDGFKNCSNLKEVYFPATCTSIPGNVFNSVASDCVFYFTGTKSQLDTLKANTNGNNTGFLNAYNQALSVDEFNALESKSGRYIVYDYNVCDAFYASTHEEDNNPCVINCTRCNTLGVAEKNPVHAEVVVISYADFAKAGVKAVTCSNAGCKYSAEESTEALFTFKGYSTSDDKMQLCVGYLINLESIKEYEANNGTSVFSYGFVASANNNTPLAVTENTVNVDLTEANYTALDFKLLGNWSDAASKEANFSMNIYTKLIEGENTKISYVYGYTDGDVIVSQSYETADQVAYNDFNPQPEA